MRTTDVETLIKSIEWSVNVDKDRLAIDREKRNTESSGSVALLLL